MLSRNATQHRSIGSAHSTQCRRGGSLRRGSGLRPAAALPPVSGPQRDALPQGAAPRRNAQPPAASESTPDVAKYKLIDAIAGCIEINDAVGRWETAAGRAAMIGFTVAFVAELLLPSKGLFGSWTGAELSIFSMAAAGAVGCSALLAVGNKRRLGGRLQEAVWASLTALSRSRGSVSRLDVDSALDSVFDQVFCSTSFYDEDI